MPFIPHTNEEITQMLSAIGAPSLEALFDEIPEALKVTGAVNQLPAGRSEMEVMRIMQKRAAQDAGFQCFLGAGAYEHHIPSAVWELVSRGEFLTSYTPYQAEASQGTLQTIYEYQTMIAHLTSMEVSNASLYDGASALAEAILMAVRATHKKNTKKVLLLGGIHPHYVQTCENIVKYQNIELECVAFDKNSGKIEETLHKIQATDLVAVVIQQPNFFGILENADEVTRWAHQHNCLVIASINPIAAALITPPGEWGDKGADIVVGEGQSLGIPLSSGGPYFGFMATKKSLIRHMPGRIVGRTTDMNGKIGFTLTLQAREQHIRRSKATSNICTNQGLAVTAATIYMSIMGHEGLKRSAIQSHIQCSMLMDALTKLGIKKRFSGEFFHEVVIELPFSAEKIAARMLSEFNIIAGLPLGFIDTAFENCLLVCVTETKNEDDIKTYVESLKQILQ